MFGANPSSRLSKRSRASDAAQHQAAHTDEIQVKRRRFSRNKKDDGKGLELIAPTVSQESTSNDRNDDGVHSTAVDKIDESSRVPWSSSQLAAGRYSDIDPVFTTDEEYLFLAVETAIHVYSTATSHLVRALQTGLGQSIIGYKLCPVNQEHLYIFTSTGSVSKWEWTTSKQVSHSSTSHKTVAIDFGFDAFESETPTSFYSLCERKDGKREIRMFVFGDENPSDTVILETNLRINHMRVAQRNRTIVAYGGHHVLFGTANNAGPGVAEHARYTWRETTLPVSITCLSIRVNTRGLQEPQNRNVLEQLDLVLGEAGGSILIYQDLLSFLVNNEENRNSEKSFAPRRLHWHRGPVTALSWSRDGNYVISGGHESVMVLWQLDTGRKQFLPHLSSPICNIVVSPTGNSFAIKLADNCVIILSARELQPYAIIIGLQLSPKMTKARGQFAPEASCGTTATVLHPQYPDQLLVAVPASRQTSQDGHCLANASVLQTYNIHTNSHISRQALARTNTTVLNVNPEGSEILSPDIKYLDISQDGKWLATVDSWSPHPQDVKALGLSDAEDLRTADHEETFLKFWKWNGFSSLWELVTRIDKPHFSDNGPTPILGLASRPHSEEFVTLGTDAMLRIWCPNSKPRSGLKTGPDAMQQLESWKCRNVIDLKGRFDPTKTGGLKAASLAFSEDGSVLAVCLPGMSTTNTCPALLIDAQKCIIHYGRIGAYSGDPCAVKFLGRYLIIASKRSVYVWNTVDDLVRVLGSPIDPQSTGNSQLLAVSPKTRTFAVATQRSRSASAKKSRVPQFLIQVYDIESLAPVFSLRMGKCLLALLSDSHSGDYVAVDIAANVQRFGCSDRTSHTATRFPELSTRLNSGLVDLFGSQGLVLQPRSLPNTSTPDTDKTSSRCGMLSGVFGDVPSFVLPPASVLFRNVVRSLSSI